MGDVFDAMSRAERERGNQPQSGEPPSVDSGEGRLDVERPTSRSGEEEKPGLPIDQVKTEPLKEDDDPSPPALAPRVDGCEQSEKADRCDDQAMDRSNEDQSLSPRLDSLNGYSDQVVVHHDRGSVITEQYRAIRTQILARSRNRRLQVHVITSSVPEEGKSVTTANLGVVFGELRNKKTLVIEGDLRRPCFHKLFGRNCTPGLLQWLRGDVADAQQIVHRTVYDNLQFIPAGGRDPTHCTQLLSSPAMTQILDRFRDHYDHIFIDTPPVVSVTDAAILAALGDQALLAVRLHKTPSEMVDRAKRLLNANGCNVSGVILTHMKTVFMPGYLSRYHYGSAYA